MHQQARSEPDEPQAPGPTPFRAAFARARGESLAAGGLPVRDSARTFEYRIVKRRSTRKADTSAWNALGRDGWELVDVTSRHATFKREL